MSSIYCTLLKQLKVIRLSPNLNDISVLRNMNDLTMCELGGLGGVNTIDDLQFCTKLEVLSLSSLTNIDLGVVKKFQELKMCMLNSLTGVKNLVALQNCTKLKQLFVMNFMGLSLSMSIMKAIN